MAHLIKLASLRHVVGAALLSIAAAATSGCSGPAGSMSKEDLSRVRSSVGSLTPGESRDAVLKAMKPANAVPLGTSVVEGITVEEWKIEAFNDSDKGRDLFVRFCYFVDGRLVDASDRRLDFRSNPELVRSWAGAAAK